MNETFSFFLFNFFSPFVMAHPQHSLAPPPSLRRSPALSEQERYNRARESIAMICWTELVLVHGMEISAEDKEAVDFARRHVVQLGLLDEEIRYLTYTAMARIAELHQLSIPPRPALPSSFEALVRGPPEIFNRK